MGTRTPAISVIIPAYNTAGYIGEALESLLAQTLQGFEVIVVDDASTDGTPTIVEAFRPRFRGRLTLLVNANNGGVSAARNRALRHARGTWIALLDSDDWYAPERLQALVEIAEGHGADLIADNLVWVSGDGINCETSLLPGDMAPGAELVVVDVANALRPVRSGGRELNLGYAKPIFRREFVERHRIAWNERLGFHEDAHFLLDCLIHGAHAVFVRKPYYCYRTRPGSLTAGHHFEQTKPWLTALDELLSQDVVIAQPALAAALRASITAIRRRYASAKMAALLQHHDYRTAARVAVQQPAAVLTLLRRVSMGLWQRIISLTRRRKTAPRPRQPAGR